jgi:methylphosphotriester-DNA--protein-cysteine methyltransferase
MKVHIVPAPECLRDDVECFRISEHTGEEGLALSVCLNGMPGIVFQHYEGHSPLKSIATRSRTNAFDGEAPTLYLYGQTTQLGIMNHKQMPFTTTQVILKPHGLRTLLGVDASQFTNRIVSLGDFLDEELNCQMVEAESAQERVALMTDFLLAQKGRERSRDALVEESLRVIRENVHSIRVKQLLEHLSISESQFEKRFTRSVGVSPQFYIRVKRFNEATKVMKARRFERLTDVAHALNFYDQSHFIRDIKEFSGLTPKILSQKQGGFYEDQGGYFYIDAV